MSAIRPMSGIAALLGPAHASAPAPAPPAPAAPATSATSASPTSPTARPHRDTRTEVRRLSHQLEGVFVAQLFQAMRATVSQAQGASPDGAGEEMFTSMFDDAVAGQAADRMQRGLGEALYRQLSRSLPPDPPAAPDGGTR